MGVKIRIRVRVELRVGVRVRITLRVRVRVRDRIRVSVMVGVWTGIGMYYSSLVFYSSWLCIHCIVVFRIVTTIVFSYLVLSSMKLSCLIFIWSCLV